MSAILSKYFWWIWAGILILAAGLRLLYLDSLPPSLYWEEAALGYDAYSISQTARDHHGNRLPIVAFESFGDWKPGLYIYATVPFISLLGVNEWAVRLPSAIAGIAIVIGVGYVSALLLERQAHFSKESSRFWQLVAMAVTAISPWAIQFSRGAWEANLATALILWAVIFGFKALPTSKKFTTSQAQSWLVAAVLLSLSLYAYHAARLIAPAVGVGLVAVWICAMHQLQNKTQPLVITALKSIRQQTKLLVLAAFVVGMMVAPLVMALGNQTVQQRFAETSIFSDLEVIKRSNDLVETAGDTWVTRLMFHRYILFGREILSNLLSHFNLTFLFISGDTNPRHSIQFMGLLYHVEFVFLLLGVVALRKLPRRYSLFLLYWLLVGLVPASLTTAVPHALRILITLPVFMVLITLGIKEFLDLWAQRWRLLVGLAIILVYLGQFGMFWRFYSQIYPTVYAHEWQYGYQEMIASLTAQMAEQPDQAVYITREQGRPAMYYWFYTQTDPRAVQEANPTVKKDQSEFLEFENLKFINTVGEVTGPGIVAASEAGYQQISSVRPVKKLAEIKDPRQQLIWVVFQVTE